LQLVKGLIKLRKASPDKASLSTHGVALRGGGAILLLVWRTSGGSKIITGMALLILAGLLLVNYKTIISQIEGI
jgi:hypothetical protein